MHHIFVINPAAGSRNAEASLRPAIEKIAAELGLQATCYVTASASDAAQFVRNTCQKGEAVRFYACGGDGTLNEVVNGAAGFENAEVACIPTGTGNDFIRSFTNPECFSDLQAQIAGSVIPMDLIHCNDRYAINMINIGFDCSVVAEAARLKKKPFLTGFMAYIVGVVVVLMQKFGLHLTIDYQNGKICSGEQLLIAIANGSFCGGGFKSAPNAILNDGLLEVCLAHKLSRMKFLRLVGNYRSGTYADTPLGKQYVECDRCPALTISPKEGEMLDICADGEIFRAAQAKISTVPGAIRFSVPKGSKPLLEVSTLEPSLVNA